LKVTDENSRIRIRIHKSEVWSRGSGSAPTFHGLQHWKMVTPLPFRKRNKKKL
jgi:hypothetical protein